MASNFTVELMSYGSGINVYSGVQLCSTCASPESSGVNFCSSGVNFYSSGINLYRQQWRQYILTAVASINLRKQLPQILTAIRSINCCRKIYTMNFFSSGVNHSIPVALCQPFTAVASTFTASGVNLFTAAVALTFTAVVSTTYSSGIFR